LVRKQKAMRLFSSLGNLLWRSKVFADVLAEMKGSIEKNGIPDYEDILEHQYSKWIKPGSIVFDIGAHTGRHLEKFINLVGPNGRVIGFEPLPFAFKELERLKASNVELFNVALGDKAGSAEFIYNEAAPEESGLQERIYNNPSQAKLNKILCEVRCLDDYGSKVPRLDFIKMDIEGGEISCLSAGVKCIERNRPLISVEYGFPSYSAYGHSKFTLYDFCEKIGYVLYDIYANSLALRRDWELACDSIYWDFFMVPKEQIKAFESKLK
jgi:FkbM family methyltransferase